MKKAVAALFLLLFVGNVQAQDKHFTQFYAVPLALNPALTGSIEGKYRVSTVYRDQWRRVLDEPLKSFGIGADLRFRPPGRWKYRTKDQLGVGMLVTNDKTGVIDFSTTQMAFSAAYHKVLDQQARQFLSAGIQYSLNQRNVNYGSLQFHDEFDLLSGYTGATAEVLPENNFSFSDFSTGLNYSGSYASGYGLFVGGAYHHFLSPSISFYGGKEEGQKLFPKTTGHVAVQVPMGDRVYLLPRALFAMQGPHMEVNAGANLKFKYGQYGGSAWHIGTWARPVRADNGFGLDALVLLTGIETGGVLIGMSYDLNLRAASKYRQRQGAFELTLTYLGEYENEEIICPKF